MDIQHYPSSWRITYHFVWEPMRAKPCLVGDIAERLEELLEQKVSELALDEFALLILPDRVYLAAKAPPTVAPHHIICQLKAHTSRTLRVEFPELTRIPTLWTRAYLVLAGEALTQEEVLGLYEAAQRPRRPRGRPRNPRTAPPDVTP
ncbi:MAG TPA: IS200/IS605 family transposase [Ktedonobacterales bacterium]